jgi:hypothetical protein
MKIELSTKGSEIFYWALTCILANTHAGALEAWAHVEALREEAKNDHMIHGEYAGCQQLGVITLAASLRIGGSIAVNNFLGDVSLSLSREMAESMAILRGSTLGNRGAHGGH